jgi:hypothetical protein
MCLACHAHQYAGKGTPLSRREPLDRNRACRSRFEVIRWAWLFGDGLKRDEQRWRNMLTPVANKLIEDIEATRVYDWITVIHLHT